MARLRGVVRTFALAGGRSLAGCGAWWRGRSGAALSLRGGWLAVFAGLRLVSGAGATGRGLGSVGSALGVLVARRALAAVLPAASALGNTEQLADVLFKDYLLPFEIASILLLVAVVGSVVMAKKRI